MAQSGHSIRADECLLLGVKRTSGGGRTNEARPRGASATTMNV